MVGPYLKLSEEVCEIPESFWMVCQTQIHQACGTHNLYGSPGNNMVNLVKENLIAQFSQQREFVNKKHLLQQSAGS